MAHRTALITAASIAAVILASAAAVGANLGILNAADSASVGELSAASAQAIRPTAVAVADDTGAIASQEYKVDKAGTVRVVATRTGVRLDDVSPKAGWKWKLVQTAEKRLSVTFKSKSTTYEFVAALGSNGKIVARVVQPVTRVAGSARVRSTSGAATSAPRWVNPAPAPAPTDDDDDEVEDHEGGEDDD